MLKKVIFAILISTFISNIGYAGTAYFVVTKEQANKSISKYIVYYGETEQADPESYPFEIDIIESTESAKSYALTGQNDYIKITKDIEDGKSYYFTIKDIYSDNSESSYFSIPYSVPVPNKVINFRK